MLCEVLMMGASYKKLWKILIDRDLRKRDLATLANVSPTTIAKLGKGESVNMDILLRICKVLDCDISDIVEVVPDEGQGTKMD
jgi:DNA-binding Xre family transcriptional regulator